MLLLGGLEELSDRHCTIITTDYIRHLTLALTPTLAPTSTLAPTPILAPTPTQTINPFGNVHHFLPTVALY